MKCPGCGKELGKYPRSGMTVGEISKRLNAMGAMTYTGAVIYFCVPCGARACDLARDLLGIVKDRNIYFAGLTNRAPLDEDPCARFIGPRLEPKGTE